MADVEIDLSTVVNVANTTWTGTALVATTSGLVMRFTFPDLQIVDGENLQIEIDYTAIDYIESFSSSGPSSGAYATSHKYQLGYAPDDLDGDLVVEMDPSINLFTDAIAASEFYIVWQTSNAIDAVITGMRILDTAPPEADPPYVPPSPVALPSPDGDGWITPDISDWRPYYQYTDLDGVPWGVFSEDVWVSNPAKSVGASDDHGTLPPLLWHPYLLLLGGEAWEPTHTYDVEVTYDPASTVRRVQVIATSDLTGSYSGNRLFLDADDTDLQQFTVGPDVPFWATAVTNGYEQVLFEFFDGSIVAGIRWRDQADIPVAPPDPPTMALKILDPEQRRAPTALTVVVGEGYANSPLTFSIDGDEVYTAYADAYGQLEALSIGVPEDTIAGTHTLTVVASSDDLDDLTASATFTLRNAPATGHVVGADADPVEVAGALRDDGARAWVFQDLMPGGLGSYVLSHNPVTDDRTDVQRNLTTRRTTGHNGRWHAAEGWGSVRDWSIAGVCFDQAEQEALESYFDLNRRFYVIDDLNEAWIVAMTGCNITPHKRANLQVRGEASELTDWLGNYVITFQVHNAEPLEVIEL